MRMQNNQWKLIHCTSVAKLAFVLLARFNECCCNADFPLFEWDEDEQRLVAMHHPFTAANPEDMQASNGASLRTARALAYDLVYNGVEIAGKKPLALSNSSSDLVTSLCSPCTCSCFPQSRACQTMHWPQAWEQRR